MTGRLWTLVLTGALLLGFNVAGGVRPAAGIDCAAAAQARIDTIEAQIEQPSAMLQGASTGQKSGLVKRLAALNAQLAQAERALKACPTPTPAPVFTLA